jgi:hypothetical protein
MYLYSLFTSCRLRFPLYIPVHCVVLIYNFVAENCGKLRSGRCAQRASTGYSALLPSFYFILLQFPPYIPVHCIVLTNHFVQWPHQKLRFPLYIPVRLRGRNTDCFTYPMSRHSGVLYIYLLFTMNFPVHPSTLCSACLIHLIQLPQQQLEEYHIPRIRIVLYNL